MGCSEDVIKMLSFCIQLCIQKGCHLGKTSFLLVCFNFGEVPKLAEGTPLERVQVVNSGARVQIPPSPLG